MESEGLRSYSLTRPVTMLFGSRHAHSRIESCTTTSCCMEIRLLFVIHAPFDQPFYHRSCLKNVASAHHNRSSHLFDTLYASTALYARKASP